MAGTLFVVATPIGNLEDLTFRALRTLKEIDLVAAEDTRRTLKLLSHYGISKPLVSLREHNESRESPKLIARLKAGKSIALVSDAGTPAIADPGARLVRAARAEGVRVVPIPGASAITAAISVSGLDSTAFLFAGFPPSARMARRQWLEGLKEVASPIVLFESPHRILETINDIESILVKRHMQLFREITKFNEEYINRPNMVLDDTGTLSTIGEFTVVIGSIQKIESDDVVDMMSVVRLFDIITGSGLISADSAIRSVATAFNLGHSTAVKTIKKGRILAKRLSEAAP